MCADHSQVFLVFLWPFFAQQGYYGDGGVGGGGGGGEHAQCECECAPTPVCQVFLMAPISRNKVTTATVASVAVVVVVSTPRTVVVGLDNAACGPAGCCRACLFRTAKRNE